MPKHKNQPERLVWGIFVVAALAEVVRAWGFLPGQPGPWAAAIVVIASVWGGMAGVAMGLRDLAVGLLPERAVKVCVALGVAAWAGACVFLTAFATAPDLAGASLLGTHGLWPPPTALVVSIAAAGTVSLAVLAAYYFGREREGVLRLLHLVVVVGSFFVVRELVATSARQLSVAFAACCWAWGLLSVFMARPAPRPKLHVSMSLLLVVIGLSFSVFPDSTKVVVTDRLLFTDALLIPRVGAPKIAASECSAETVQLAVNPGTANGIVVVVIDTLRHDRVNSKYMPAVAAWADSASLRFERVYTPAPSTQESFTEMFGLDADATVFARLHGAGVTTRAVTAHPGVTSITESVGVETDGRAHADQDFRFALTSSAVTDIALEHLAELESKGAPFVLLVHYYDPHEYYVDNPNFEGGSTRIERYDAEVAYTDLHVGRLLEAAGKFATVVASDHGEEFWEHGYVSHSRSLYDESARVFLAANVPGAEPATVQPTVDNEVLGQLLVAVANGTELRASVGPVRLEKTHKRAIVTGSMKWLWHDESEAGEVYDLTEDPLEQNNLAEELGFEGSGCASWLMTGD